MKCNQCEMLQISTAGVSLPCHEIGCPNAHKEWDEENELWYTPDDDEDWEPEDWEYQDQDLGGTGHGDISHSDADPGL